MRLRHAHRQSAIAQLRQALCLFFGFGRQHRAAAAVHARRQVIQLLLDAVRRVIGEREIVFLPAQPHDLARQRQTALAALRPDLAGKHLHALRVHRVRERVDFRVGIVREAVDRHHARKPEHVLDIPHMPPQVFRAREHRVHVFPCQRILLHAAVHLQRANRGHDHHRVGTQTRHAALDVQKLLRAQIGAKTGFRHGIVRQTHRHTRGKHTVAAVRDIGKRPAVHQHGRMLKRLHEIRLKRFLQKRRHCARRLQIARRNRLIVIGIADDDAPEPRLQIGKALGQAQDRHDFAGHGNVVAILARTAVRTAAEPVHDAAQLTVVHVHAPPPRNAPRIEVQRVALINMVVDHCRQKVVGRADRVEVAGEMQVDFVHRRHLRIAAARRAALQAEHRPQRRLAQRRHRALVQPAQRVGQSNAGSRLALARGRGRDRRHKH